MSEENIEKKDIEIITGDGKDLNISPVYENISDIKPKSKDEKPTNIVIPKPKK